MEAVANLAGWYKPLFDDWVVGESGWSNEAESDEKAIGIFQFLPPACSDIGVNYAPLAALLKNNGISQKEKALLQMGFFIMRFGHRTMPRSPTLRAMWHYQPAAALGVKNRLGNKRYYWWGSKSRTPILDPVTSQYRKNGYSGYLGADVSTRFLSFPSMRKEKDKYPDGETMSDSPLSSTKDRAWSLVNAAGYENFEDDCLITAGAVREWRFDDALAACPVRHKSDLSEIIAVVKKYKAQLFSEQQFNLNVKNTGYKSTATKNIPAMATDKPNANTTNAPPIKEVKAIMLSTVDVAIDKAATYGKRLQYALLEKVGIGETTAKPYVEATTEYVSNKTKEAVGIKTSPEHKQPSESVRSEAQAPAAKTTAQQPASAADAIVEKVGSALYSSVVDSPADSSARLNTSGTTHDNIFV